MNCGSTMEVPSKGQKRQGQGGAWPWAALQSSRDGWSGVRELSLVGSVHC